MKEENFTYVKCHSYRYKTKYNQNGDCQTVGATPFCFNCPFNGKKEYKDESKTDE